MSEVLITSFKNWPIHHHWEKVMAAMLKARGYNVRFFTCQYPFFRACEAYDVNTSNSVDRRSSYCRDCYSSFRNDLAEEVNMLQLSQYVSRQELRRIELLVKSSENRDLLKYPICDTNLLEIIRPSLYRYFRVGNHNPEHTPPEVLQNYAYTALMIEHAMNEILRQDRPELVITLNSQFFGENIVWRMARAAGVRVVNYERSPFHNALVFSDDEPAHMMNVETAWLRQKDTPLTYDEKLLVEGFLESRRQNLDSYFDYRSRNPIKVGQGDARKQAVLFTNLTWDSSVVSQKGIFDSPRDWLAATIEWFREHKEYSLVVRVHPGETKLLYDPTLDSIYEHLLLTHDLPDNITIIPPEAEVDSYQLMAESDCGVVLCTTAGLEMAAMGKPVVMVGQAHFSGKGFTIDCKSRDDYQAQLLTALNGAGDQNSGTISCQARKYLLTVFLRYAVPFPMVDEYEYGRGHTRWLPESAAQLAADPLATSLADFLEGKRKHPLTIADYELEDLSSLLRIDYHFSLPRESNTSSPQLSVIIPTYQRVDSLRSTLEAYCKQSLATDRWELLLVADGDDPEIAQLCQEYSDSLPVVYHAIEHAGPAAARNAGIMKATGQVILITGDDIEPHEDMLLQHLRMHLEHPESNVAILGHIEWPEDMEVNVVMKLVNENGQQFSFNKLKDGREIGPEFFYTSNISLKAELLHSMSELFKTEFPGAALEDIEFGVRLSVERQMRIIYNAAACGYHRHKMTLESFALRQQSVGRSTRILERVAPDVFKYLNLGAIVSTVPDRQEMVRLEESARALQDTEVSKLNWILLDEKPFGGVITETRRRLLQRYFELKVAEGYYQHGYHGSAHGVPGKVSIIIPAYNNLNLTLQAIKAVQDNTVYHDYEIILVDNASADGTREYFQNSRELFYIRNEQNLGFARANNQAAEVASGEYLLLLNNDTIVQPGWLTHMIDSLEPDVGIVGARLIYADETIQHAGVAFGEGDHPPYHIYPGLPMRHPSVNRRREFNAVTAACMLIRRQVYADLKGLNENYINCYEDVDLCLQARKAGWRIIYEPKALVVHLEGKSAGRQDKLIHSYQLLMERWRDTLRRDDLEFYEADGFKIVPRGKGKVLREDIQRIGQEWLLEADRLLQEGKLQDVAWILDYAGRFKWLQDELDARLKQIERTLEEENLQEG